MTHHGCGLAARSGTSPDPKEETYTATRVSHPNCSRFTCPAAGLPSPLTHLWRPPAIAGAGGHTQVDSGTPYRGHGQPRGTAGQAPTSPDQAERPPGLPTTPQPHKRRHHPWWGRPAPRPPPTTTRKRRPRQGGPGTALPPTTRQVTHRCWSPFAAHALGRGSLVG